MHFAFFQIDEKGIAAEIGESFLFSAGFIQNHKLKKFQIVN